jgi:chaperone modulatory protein CbpM
MVDRQQFLMRARLETRTLEAYIEEEWVIPRREAGIEEFSDADVARAHLIQNLQADIGVNDEGIGVILHLIDQLHGLRRTLQDILQERRASTTKD